MRWRTPIIIALVLISTAEAWVRAVWSPEALMNAATLAVIARPIKVTVVSARQILPNVTSGYADDPNVYVDDVETTFDIITILKGASEDGTLVLHHLRYTNNPGLATPGPGLVSFEPGSGKCYRMYLRSQADGRWVAVTGLLESDLAVVWVHCYAA